jgi:ABC-type phosphate/phosphonate transport system ATPase subunit
LCSVLEVCKYAQDEITKNDLSSDDFQKIFLDEMVSGLFDIKCLGSSFEGTNTLMYLINGSVKGIDGYIKRLIDEIRITLKKNDLKASRTKIALSWTLDQHAMRGDKIEMLQNLTTRLRDYIGDVEAYEDSNYDLFHSDKTTIVVACSKTDFEHIEKTKQDSNLIVVKANPLCETIQ